MVNAFMRQHRFYKGRALDRELRAIYEERGKIPDMTKLEHEYHRRTTRMLIGFVAFFALLAAASWAGFLFFGQPGTGGNMEINFTGPQNVLPGIPQDITLTYKNLDNKPLAFSQLLLRPSDNLIIQQADPAPTEQGRWEWNFGTLPANYSGEILLKVIPYGLVSDKVDLPAIFTFKPADFNAEFRVSKTHTFNIETSPFSMSFDPLEQVLPGQEISVKANFVNVSDETFEKIQVAVALPPNFSLQNTDVLKKEPIWEFETLPPNENKEIAFNGTFLSGAQGQQKFVLSIGIARAAEKFYPLAQAEIPIIIQESNIQADILINESQEQQWARLGQILDLKIKLTNKSEQSLDKIQLQVPVNGALVDLASVQATDGVINGNTIIFPPKDGLSLGAHETKEFTAVIPLAKSGAPGQSPFIEFYAEVLRGEIKLRTRALKIIAVSDLALASEARYFGADGKQIGNGQFPPKVGQETDFIIRWRLKNTYHDLSNIAVITTLPNGIIWKNASQTQAGKILFNETTREVRWEIPRLPITTPEISAQFEIGAIPSATDQGKLISLIGVARAEALDTIAQTTFSTDAPMLSSNLDADPFGKGKGVVQ